MIKRPQRSRAVGNSPSAGFTIVEVVIVLAIAGLILLIVFEAIPALQRGSRNSARKQDVAVILQTIAHSEFNNSGNFPASCGTGYPQPCDDGTNNSLLYYVKSKLQMYDPTTNSITVDAQNASATDHANTGSVNTVDVYNFERCSTATQGDAVTSGADYTNIVALYALEAGGGGSQAECQQL